MAAAARRKIFHLIDITHRHDLVKISIPLESRDRFEVAPGVTTPPMAVASYMSVLPCSCRYSQRLDLSWSSRGASNGARWRIGKFALGGPNLTFGECAAGRRSRPPGRPGTNPGANDI